MKKEKNVRRKMSVLTVIITAVLIFIASALGVWTLAKYVISKTGDTPVEPADFVFLSDLAKDSNVSYDIYTDSVTINLYNYQGVNRSGTDISYNISVSSTDGGTCQVSSNSGTLSANGDNTASITFSGLQAGKSYNITAATSGSYAKTLYCTFNVKDDYDQTVYSYTDNGSWGVLKINVGNYNGTLNINYGNLSPDNTNPMMTDWQDGNTDKTVTVTKYGYYELIFFEHNGNAGNISNTTVTNNTISIGANP